MSGDINLLPSQAKFQAKQISVKSKISSFLWIFVGGWVLLIIIVMGGFLVSKLIANQVNNKYQSVFNQYKTLLNSMVVNQQVKYQAKVVSQVLAERFEYGSSIEMVKSLFSENIKIEDIGIESKEQFVLSGIVNNGKFMSEVEQIVVSINNGEMDGFSGAILKDVQVKSGIWTFEMEVTLK